MTKIDKNASKFKKIDYFGKSTQSFLLVHKIVSYDVVLAKKWPVDAIGAVKNQEMV